MKVSTAGTPTAQPGLQPGNPSRVTGLQLPSFPPAPRPCVRPAVPLPCSLCPFPPGQMLPWRWVTPRKVLALEHGLVCASALHLHHPCSADPPGAGASPPPGAGERRSPSECMGRARVRDETGWVGSVVNQCSDSQGPEALAPPGGVGQE